MTRHRAPRASSVVTARHSTRARRHPWWVSVAWATSAIAGFSLVLVQTTVMHIEDAFTTRDVAQLYDVDPADGPVEPADPEAGRPVNILVMGSDVRDGENGEIGGKVDGMRADATMIMHISADRSRVELLSIPRDMRVRVADCQLFDGSTVPGWTAKFNVAFANGGVNGDPAEAAACAMRTVSDLTGVRFDHYTVVDFAGFRDMIDALDGVPMCVPHRMSSPKAKLDVEAGPQVFDGDTALAWARARTGTGLGDGTDLGRIDRQQELLSNTFRKAVGMNMLTDTGALTRFVRAVAESLYMDPTLGSVTYLGGLAYSLRGIDTDDIVFETVPWEYAGDNSGDVVMTADALPMFERLVFDEPLVDREPEPEPSPSPSAGAEPSPSPSAGAEPSPSPSAPKDDDDESAPARETEQDILDACA